MMYIFKLNGDGVCSMSLQNSGVFEEGRERDVSFGWRWGSGPVVNVQEMVIPIQKISCNIFTFVCLISEDSINRIHNTGVCNFYGSLPQHKKRKFGSFLLSYFYYIIGYINSKGNERKKKNSEVEKKTIVKRRKTS